MHQLKLSLIFIKTNIFKFLVLKHYLTLGSSTQDVVKSQFTSQSLL